MLEEGGYYAIKGFSYQYIISLIEVLNCKDENKVFSFEQLQDFNDNELIYQMKYKETQHFTNSKIKEPTIKVFSEYLETKKDYVLYVYFPDKTDETLLFNTSNDLDKVLLNCKIDKKEYNFTEEQKKEFIKHFKVIFSKDYMDKSNELIELISKIMNTSKEISEIYYFSLITYIINIIVNNIPKKRNCTKKELLTYLVDSASKIFHDYSLKYYGKERYIKSIKKEYFFEKNINNHNRLFIINMTFTSIDDYYDCICKIVKRFYVINKRRTMIISSAPYIYLPNIQLSDLVKLKAKLFNSIGFTDGYIFKDSDFNIDYITKKFAIKDNISCKLVNIEDDIMKIIDKLSNDGIKIYQFYDKKNEILYKSLNQISIEIDEVNDICKILK